MNSETLQSPCELDCTLDLALQALVGVKRVQVGVRTGLVLHERQGAIETVDLCGDWVRIGGAEHDSEINHSAVHRLVLQENQAAMSDRILPRLMCIDASGSVIMTLLGLGDPQGFSSALRSFKGADCSAVPGWPRPVTPVSGSDAGLSGLQEFVGQQIVLTMAVPAALSRWTGELNEVRIGESFINIVRPSVHMHLRGGAVSRWETEGDQYVAIGQDGQNLGLSIKKAGQ